MRYLITIGVLAFFLQAPYLNAQGLDSTKESSSVLQTDTTTSSNIDPYEGTDDFSPGLALFALIGIGFILACVGAGIGLTVIGLLIIFGLISFGILSASVIVGINRKSFAKGFKTFLISTSTIGGVILCASGFWIFNIIVPWSTTQEVIMIGAALGLLAGLTFGVLSIYLLRRMTAFLKQQLDDRMKTT